MKHLAAGNVTPNSTHSRTIVRLYEITGIPICKWELANLGSNGIIVDPQGQLIVCAHRERALLGMERVMKLDGTIYFTHLRQANNSLMERPPPAVVEYARMNGIIPPSTQQGR
jgi:hypothetical protein